MLRGKKHDLFDGGSSTWYEQKPIYSTPIVHQAYYSSMLCRHFSTPKLVKIINTKLSTPISRSNTIYLHDHSKKRPNFVKSKAVNKEFHNWYLEQASKTQVTTGNST